MDLCPWADVVYGCDHAWWVHRRGLPEYHGLKVCWSGNGLDEFSDIRRVDIAKLAKPSLQVYSKELILSPAGTIGGGGNSGFQALNLAVQWGARRIILVGFDMSDRGDVHWYGRNNWSMANNPGASNFRRWIGAFEGIVPALRSIGAEVVNSSPISALACFPKMSIEEALAAWDM